jgi:hypothetical protein
MAAADNFWASILQANEAQAGGRKGAGEFAPQTLCSGPRLVNGGSAPVELTGVTSTATATIYFQKRQAGSVAGTG